jgi:hypothetical protein
MAAHPDRGRLFASFVHFLNSANEPIPPVRQGTNKALLLAVVTNRATNCADAAAERRFRNDASIPDVGNQIVSADDSAAISYKMQQDTENLRFNRDNIGPPPQLISVGVERVCFESVDHLQLHHRLI